MSLCLFNPLVRGVDLYEKAFKYKELAAPDARIFYVLSGDLGITLAGEKPRHVGPGGLCYVPAGRVFSIKTKLVRMVVLAFDFYTTESGRTERMFAKPAAALATEAPTREGLPCPFDSPFVIEDLADERENLLKMNDIFTTEAKQAGATVSAMLKLLLLRLADTAGADSLPVHMAQALDSYLWEHRGEEISNTEIGAVFGYHPFYVSQMLKKKLGITLRQYVIAYRIRTAKKLLANTELTVAQIAEATGFSDASYFTKSFKADTGMTPKDYRAALADTTL